METMQNINSVSVVVDDSSTRVSVTQQDNQLLLVTNGQSRDIIGSLNQHPPMKMPDPLEVFKQTVNIIFFCFVLNSFPPSYPCPYFSRLVCAPLLSHARLECRKVIQPRETEAAKFPDFVSPRFPSGISFYLNLHSESGKKKKPNVTRRTWV